MAVFILKGDTPMSARQATKRGMAIVARQLAEVGARKGDEELLRVIPHSELPDRLKALIEALGCETYADYALEWERDNEANGANNLFNHQLAAYRAAVVRLRRYRLGVGQYELLEQVETEELDPETGTPAMVTVIALPAIEALTQLVEVPIFDPLTGAQTDTQVITNPLIVQDETERAAAQALIDQTPTEVKAFAEMAVT